MPKCQFDMYSLTKESRLSVDLKAAKWYGVDRRAAVAFISLAEGETGYVFLTHRPYDIASSSNCCAVPVGLETVYFDSAMRASPKTLSFLAQKGWVKTEGGVLKPTGGLGNPLKPWKTMAAFEFAYLSEEPRAIGLTPPRARSSKLPRPGLLPSFVRCGRSCPPATEETGRRPVSAE